MTHAIDELKTQLETQRAELVAANQANGAAFARHLSAWGLERDSKQESILAKVQQIQTNRLKINGVAMSDFELTKLHSENEQMRRAIIDEKNLLIRFLAEPSWQKKAGESVEARIAHMRALAITQTELEIAKLEVKSVLTADILEKIKTLYDHLYLSHSFPMNLCADLNKFVTLL